VLLCSCFQPGPAANQLVPTPVHVVFVVVGHVVVDHQHQVPHIQAACCNTGGDQDIAHGALEVTDGALAVALLLATMQAEARVASLSTQPGEHMSA